MGAADARRILLQRKLIGADLQPQSSSLAVQVPPSACHCSTMLWRRKSMTEMVVALSTAHSSTPRDHFAGASANALCMAPAVRSCGRTSGSVEPGFEL